MSYLSGAQAQEAEKYLEEAARVALRSTCERDQCGCIIVAEGKIIGRGFNSPPGEKESQRRCSCDKSLLHPKVTDKTCCVHAEQRAILDALRTFPDQLLGATLYFARLDKQGIVLKSGKPYCTICSKMALDVGIGLFVLAHEHGITAYETEEYNLLSFAYKGQP